MEQGSGKLPSFKSLAVIAAVVRHQSFTAASHELHVTPSAVSKQVAQIEAWLGVSLFQRVGGAALALPEAHRLASAVDEASDLLARAIDEIRPEPPRGTLRVAAPATFAMRWLIPRLWTFSASHPGVSVDVTQTHARDELSAVNYDIAIRQGPSLPPDAKARRIMTDALGLVLAPRLLRSRRAGHVDLSRVAFLESESRPGELDRWLGHAAPDLVPGGPRRRFPHFYIALEAALSGEGALVAPVVTLADLLKSGHLCEARPECRIPGNEILAFTTPGRSPTRESRAFLTWLETIASDRSSSRKSVCQRSNWTA